MIQQPLPYTIRPMEPGDIPAVVAIDRLSFPTPWSASSYLYEIGHRGQSYFYVLLEPQANDPAPPAPRLHRWLRGLASLPQEGSRVIGYMGLRRRGPGAHISTIAVHPDWLGRGLGELLLLTAMEQAQKLRLDPVTLEVRASNQVAQQLYRKYGFRYKGVHQGYYRDGEDAWLMKVEISQDAYRARLAELRQALEARLRHQHAELAQHAVGQNIQGGL
jgi:ribosomal-protein-alanine N-acetyltransferase